MHQSILQALFNGEIDPSESIGKTRDDNRLNQEISNEKNHFKAILSSEDWERFEDLIDMGYDRSSNYGYQCFAYGFRLCMALMVEAFIKTDILSRVD